MLEELPSLGPQYTAELLADMGMALDVGSAAQRTRRNRPHQKICSAYVSLTLLSTEEGASISYGALRGVQLQAPWEYQLPACRSALPTEEEAAWGKRCREAALHTLAQWEHLPGTPSAPSIFTILGSAGSWGQIPRRCRQVCAWYGAPSCFDTFRGILGAACTGRVRELGSYLRAGLA